MNIGDRVKALREKKGFTQSELAEKLGYKSKTSVAHIENGREIPRAMIVKLSDILETSPAYLMGWEEESVSYDNNNSSYNSYKISEVYLSFAKDAEAQGIPPEDIKLAIELINKIRKNLT